MPVNREGLSLAEQTFVLWAARLMDQINLENLCEYFLEDKDLIMDRFALRARHYAPSVEGVCLRVMWQEAEGVNKAIFVEMTYQGRMSVVGDTLNGEDFKVGKSWGIEQEGAFGLALRGAVERPYQEVDGRWVGDSFYYPVSSIRL